MRKSTKITSNWGRVIVAMSVAAAALSACSDDNEAPAPELTIPAQSEMIGGWEAEGYRWDLDRGKSACYLMTDDGKDFAYDEQGNYITVTVREYCEQYAEDYNADPKNEIKGTPENFADHAYEGSYLFTNLNVTDTHITIYSGQRIPGAGIMAVLSVSGQYVYDPATGSMTVDDVAVKDEPRTLLIEVTKSKDGRMNFRYSDYDLYLTPTYDQTKSYYVYAPMIFYCVPGEPYIPEQ